MKKILKITPFLNYALAFALIVLLLAPLQVSAAQLTSRSLTLGSSAASATTTHQYNFTIPASANLGSATFTYCTTPSGACSAPNGLNVDGVSITGQTGATGFTVDATTTTANVIGITRTAASASGAVSYTFNSAVNPNTANQTFYVRIATFNANNFTGAQDSGTVAGSTASQIQLSGTMDESLVFCVGTSITGTNCGTIAGSAVSFGTFSTVTPSTGTSVMAASTNGSGGYSITVNGATLTSGSYTIPALTTQTGSSAGTSQFGMNLASNTTPSVGAAVSGTGTATASANYGTTNQFRFVSGDTVASAAAATNANAFTVSYLANVAGAQQAGIYTATMTYICTATF